MLKEYLKKIVRKRIYSLLLSDSTENKHRFISNFLVAYHEQVYAKYKQKYSIDDSFNFNGENILFYGEGKIVCGKNSYIGHWSMIQSFTNCTVMIGDGCNISSNVRIFTQTNISDQDFSDPNREIKTGDVIIGDHVWIGANVIINPSIKIGNNSIIGANSVVTADIPDNAIYGGVPAKLIKLKTKK